ncbi:hypothetical protein AC579_8159 [Pseudocercospora musae]|uniref:Transcription factor domain-containing protein n=1 Tax=Pseudocercospora musae TaxID=113226 RepID=A0A139IV71_9PEZI|nr:hypothetical protein AC579_8159 [Pseudocercospora musae]
MTIPEEMPSSDTASSVQNVEQIRFQISVEHKVEDDMLAALAMEYLLAAPTKLEKITPVNLAQFRSCSVMDRRFSRLALIFRGVRQGHILRREARLKSMCSSKGSTDADVGFDSEFLESIFDPSLFSADIWPGGNASHLETWPDFPQVPNDEDDYDLYGVTDCEVKLDVIIKSILCVRSVTRLGEAEQKSMTAQLKQLFAPSRTARFLRYYFDCWHRNCRYVHKPSLSVEDKNEPLLPSMAPSISSADEDERAMASEIMFHAEKYIFFHGPLFGEQSLGKCSAAAKHGDFQTVQAGLCMLVIQFWTGDEAAK